jgi:hypothetical protein
MQSDKPNTQAYKSNDLHPCGGKTMNNILVIATIALAGFALYQALLIRDFNSRSLRAYVCVSQCYLTDGEQPSGMVEIKNFGKTPASKVKHWIGISINTVPITGQLGALVEGPASISVLAPTVPLALPVKLKIPLRPNDQAIFGSARCTAYVFGKVTYEDIYGSEWTTHFQFFWDGHTASKELGGKTTRVRVLRIDTKGNELT